MNEGQLVKKLRSLLKLPSETEWVEFKANNSNNDDIGEYISALANVAGLLGKEAGYLVWGVEDITHHVVATKFKPRQERHGNQELESWLGVHLKPAIDFRFYEFTFEGVSVVLCEIPPCQHTPITWKDVAYIRVGSYKKKLKDFPEKERALWSLLSRKTFEKEIVMSDVSGVSVLSLLDFDAYYRMAAQPLPSSQEGILERFVSEKMIVKLDEAYGITNLGAILFANRLSDFESLGRKAMRVITYTGTNRVTGGRDHIANQGYASGYEGLIAYINSQQPINEQIGQALRIDVLMYPEIVIRELVANAMIHQDFSMKGDSPTVEIFKDRIEIANGGKPLIDPLRFVDEPPESRNEMLASFMRRIKICEERGSGIDKVINAVEFFQLPPPEFLATERHTKVHVYAHKPFKDMNSNERVRACYQHVTLMHVFNQHATNATLRKRFRIEDEDYQVVSKIIANTINAKLIKPFDPLNNSRRSVRYVPIWA